MLPQQCHGHRSMWIRSAHLLGVEMDGQLAVASLSFSLLTLHALGLVPMK